MLPRQPAYPLEADEAQRFSPGHQSYPLHETQYSEPQLANPYSSAPPRMPSPQGGPALYPVRSPPPGPRPAGYPARTPPAGPFVDPPQGQYQSPFLTPSPAPMPMPGGPNVDYISRGGYNNNNGPSQQPPSTYNVPSQAPSTYSLHDPFIGEPPSRRNSPDDEGDAPLLNRGGSFASSNGQTYNMPGGLDDEPETNIRYGKIPQRVPRRYKTIKRVELYKGNLVIDCPVPSKLLEMCANKTDREMTFMRYTAATCDPDEFKNEGYTLRQVLYEPPRRTELFIVMTMYNEDEELYARTMSGVLKNIAHLCTRERSKTWGKEGWKKVVVCIVSDGRAKINSRTLSAIAAMGIYQDGVAKNVVNKKPVAAHIYEYTTQINVSPNVKFSGSEKSIPCQVIFCLKEKNQKKINSHRWFFNAFGPVLQPNVCVLLDVGTMPGPTSIYHLWKAFDINSNVGGACGEIVAMKGKLGVNLLNPLVAAQNFEYKMSNILDKPLESVFGYITVLPGAFSAYRYIALQNDSTGNGPLQKYFLGETMHGANADIFTANMYLAEDRILCWELVSKRGCSWLLHYVKSAYAITDVPDSVPELISQRRRWLNGSFFAAIHATTKFRYIYRSSHNFMRKMWIHIEMIYQTFNLIFSWFALANYYISFVILTQSTEELNIPGIHIINIVLHYVYIGLLLMCFLLSMGNRPQGSKLAYTAAMIGFAFITVYMTAAAILLAVKGIESVASSNNGIISLTDFFANAIFRNIVLSLLATLGLYFISSFLFFEPWHMFTSFIQYLLMAPSYINVLNVYAFSNVHDISWGTKGDNKVSTDLGVVATGPNKNEVEVEVPTNEKDINAAYQDALHVLSDKPPEVKKKRDAATKQEDYYRSFRTNVRQLQDIILLPFVLLAWTLSNGALAAIITSATGNISIDTTTGSSTVNGYMAFVLFSVAGLAFFRFLGATTYLITRLFAGE